MRLSALPGGGIRALAPAKINLYLDVVGRRPDGYHEIDTLMQEVSLCDELEVRRAPAGAGVLLKVVEPGGGPSPLTEGPENRVLKAARLLAGRAGPPLAEAGLRIRLLKRIPVGAGLGGGSSDAAATLLALKTLFEIDLPLPELTDLAAQLGSDVPFFLHGGTARCRGRGEKVTPLGEPPGGEQFHYVLVYPGIEVSTSLIYRELDRAEKPPSGLTSRQCLDTMSAASIWKELRDGTIHYNRLQVVACQAFPELLGWLKEVEREPLTAVLMSGSGSAIYGVCGSRQEAEAIAPRLERRLRGKVFAVQSGPAPCLPPGGLPGELSSRG